MWFKFGLSMLIINAFHFLNGNILLSFSLKKLNVNYLD